MDLCASRVTAVLRDKFKSRPRPFEIVKNKFEFFVGRFGFLRLQNTLSEARSKRNVGDITKQSSKHTDVLKVYN